MITNQAYLFSIFIINGVIIGLLFDFFRVLRISFKTNNLITYIEDILFWILTGSLILYSSFIFNNGEIRFYMFLGIFIGALLYMLFVSKYFIKINVKVIDISKNIIGKFIKLIFTPCVYIYKFIRKLLFKPCSFVVINIKKISTFLFNKSKINLKNSRKAIKNAK